MVRRITTNGMMMSYKSNLMCSYNNLAGVTEKVTTHRQFNSYAENPSKASQAFQLRRTRWNVENQLSNNKQVRHKFQQAWDCMDDTYQDLGTKLVKYSSLRAENDADAGGRQALGEVIKGAADSVMQTMNAKYGENFIFSGADGQTVPFSWGADGKLLYWGPNTNGAPTPAAENVQAFSVLKDYLYQYLTPQGEVYALAVFSKDPSPKRIAEDVCVLFDGGFIKNDHTQWLWEGSEEDGRPVKVREGVQAAADRDFYVDTYGRLHWPSNGQTFPVPPRSVRSLNPTLQNLFLLSLVPWLLYERRQKKNAGKNAGLIQTNSAEALNRTSAEFLLYTVTILYEPLMSRLLKASPFSFCSSER